MIFLTKDYSLKMCLGEAAVTELDIVVRYRRHRSANNQGSVSWVASPDVAVMRTNDTSEITLLAAPAAADRVDYIAYPVICNRDTIAHTLDLWVEHTNGTKHYLLDRDGFSLAAGRSLCFTEEGEPKIFPESPGILTVPEGGTGGVSFTDGAFIIGNAANGFQAIGPGTAGQIPVSQGAGVDPIMRSVSGDATLASTGVMAILSASTTWARTGIISVGLSADHNDWSPTGFSAASVIRVDPQTTIRTITGISGGSAGRIVTIINTGSFALAFQNEGGGSIAANRFYLGGQRILGNPTVYLWKDDSITFIYDATDSRWKVLSKNVCVPSFSAYLGSNQVGITTSSWTKVQAATELIDTHGWYDNALYRFTPLLPGKYQFTFSLGATGIADGRLVLAALRKNGLSTEIARGSMVQLGAASDSISHGAKLVSMSGTDYVELFGIHDDPAADFIGLAQYTFFEAVWVGD